MTESPSRGATGGMLEGIGLDGDLEQSELAGRVKQLQRVNDEGKRQWWAFCEAEGFNHKKDPYLHTTEFLRQFFEARSGGRINLALSDAREGADGDSNHLQALVHRVKASQRQSPDGKYRWEFYCDSQCNGIRDPSRHEEHSLKRFLDEYLVGGAGVLAGASQPQTAWGAAAAALYSGAYGSAYGGAAWPGIMGRMPWAGMPGYTPAMYNPSAAAAAMPFMLGMWGQQQQEDSASDDDRSSASCSRSRSPRSPPPAKGQSRSARPESPRPRCARPQSGQAQSEAAPRRKRRRHRVASRRSSSEGSRRRAAPRRHRRRR